MVPSEPGGLTQWFSLRPWELLLGIFWNSKIMEGENVKCLLSTCVLKCTVFLNP